MIAITTKQARTRYTTIPPVLQDAVFSVQNAEIIGATIEKYHIPGEKAEKIPDLVGWVLLGFLHPEDLPDEIMSAVGITREFANEISNTFNEKIFKPIRPTLDTSYKPVPEGEVGAIPAPKIMSETKTVAPTAPAPAPIGTARVTPPPTPMAQKGWSTMKSTDVIPPKPPATPATGTPSTPAAPFKMTTGMPMTAPMPRPVPMAAPIGGIKPNTPLAPTPPVAPKPAPTMMVKSEEIPKIIKNAPDLRATSRSTENIMPGGSSQTPLRPAILELGSLSTQNQKMPVKNPASEIPKVVHYSDLKSSLPAQLPAVKTPVPESGRHIVEMTATPVVPTPTPIKPATPAAAPNTSFSALSTPPTIFGIASKLATPNSVSTMPSPIKPAAPAMSGMPKSAMPTPVPVPPMPPFPTKPIAPATPLPTPPKPLQPIAPAAPMNSTAPTLPKVIVKDFTAEK